MAVKDPSSPHGLRLVIEDYPFAVDGLEAWWKELVEVGHADHKDKSWWPKMQTRQDLIQTCTIIIWTSSALHAAVNFGHRRLLPEEGTKEYEEMKTNPERALLKTITPKLQTLIDLSVIEILSRHASDEVYLGTRDNPNWTSDEKPLEAFKRFGKTLEEIEVKLVKRNEEGSLRNRIGPVNMPYTLLYPTSEEGLTARGIPNSISI
ncbi:seed linoleate 9S-lipoxygenase-3 [Senna tora]|uniref:Seed linoleate 9S-lipoxygenase-3 n=1 Tax=Senna tora TaxID=362788 RepID=A0A835CKK6_9FABA|nr:seed linoleate 9S-lipoxygenase-3 [Senna tora]